MMDDSILLIFKKKICSHVNVQFMVLSIILVPLITITSLLLSRKGEFPSGCLENVFKKTKKQTRAQILHASLEAPLAALTASSLLGRDSISLNLGTLCGSSLQSLCLSVWMVTARLRTFQNTTVLITLSSLKTQQMITLKQVLSGCFSPFQSFLASIYVNQPLRLLRDGEA